MQSVALGKMHNCNLPNESSRDLNWVTAFFVRTRKQIWGHKWGLACVAERTLTPPALYGRSSMYASGAGHGSA